MEVIKLENIGNYREDMIMGGGGDIFLLQVCFFTVFLSKRASISFFLSFIVSLTFQLCGGVDENSVGTCAELIFAPIDSSFADDAPLLPSGFRIIPLDSRTVSI